MHINESGDTVRWDAGLCILCKMCTVACPFGNAVYNASDQKIIKCDMCQGDPECVRFCPSGALTYVEDTIAVRDRKKAFAAKFKAAFKEVS
jgi:Fe-S-cluster-containing hydrogenase component 2